MGTLDTPVCDIDVMWRVRRGFPIFSSDIHRPRYIHTTVPPDNTYQLYIINQATPGQPNLVRKNMGYCE